MNKDTNEIYVDMLIETLQKKQNILDNLIHLTKEQTHLLGLQPFSMDDFDAILDQKDEKIKELNELDDGFMIIYQRVKDIVLTKRALYKGQLKQMQNLIRDLTDKGTYLQSLELSNKVKVEVVLNNKRSEIRQVKVSSQTANKYYKNMMNLNQNDSIFYDQKK